MIFRNLCSIIGVVDIIIENNNCDILYISWFNGKHIYSFNYEL